MRHALLSAVLGLALIGDAQAATITIIPGSGFADATPVTPVGGNTATTRGQARLQLFQKAAQIWGSRLKSPQTIYAYVNFTTLACSSSQGLLGQASPNGYFKGFAGAPMSNVYYAEALANALANKRLDGSIPTTDPNGADIQADFNSAIDSSPSCLGGMGFYYGLDNNAGSKIDLLNVVMHEFSHGLGFDTLVDPSTGNGIDSTSPSTLSSYDQLVFDETREAYWPQLTASQRAASAVNDGNLVWNGEQVNSATPLISYGVTASGHLRLYAPTSVEQGSSIAHWDDGAEQSLLMRPFASTAQMASLGVDVTVCALADMGWAMASGIVCPDTPGVYKAPVAKNGGVSLTENSTASVTLSGTAFNGGSLTYTITVNPMNGTLSGTAPNLVYMPNANFTGADSIQFTVNDGQRPSTPGTISIQVKSESAASGSKSGAGAMPSLLLFGILGGLRAVLRRRRR